MNKTELKARRESIRRTYRELEQPATIIVLAERFLRQDPLDGVVWAWYGHTLMEMGRYAEADAALKTARGLVTTDDEKAFALECRGDLEEAQGRLAEAAGLYREANALVPDRQSPHLKLGRAHPGLRMGPPGPGGRRASDALRVGTLGRQGDATRAPRRG